jgi:hypothetical protein
MNTSRVLSESFTVGAQSLTAAIGMVVDMAPRQTHNNQSLSSFTVEFSSELFIGCQIKSRQSGTCKQVPIPVISDSFLGFGGST